MSLEKKDFYGKEVTAAIKNACDTLGVAQEKLEIEIIETGSTGIFGLIRKKAHIRVLIKPEVEEISADVFEVDSYIKSEPEEILKPDSTTPETVESEPEKAEPFSAVEEKVVEPVQKVVVDVNQDQNVKKEKEPEVEVSLESVEIVKTELLQLVELMGFPSTLEVETAGLSVACTLRGDFEENLTGTDGKVLDSLQYILRKVISRKVPERLRISINIGDFRERRLEELKVRAVELATQVKEDGKTQVLPALNPSERRVIHMILQEDKEIRSRSVGDGLFKKILIYKPGKGNRPSGRKRSQSRGRQNKSSSKKGSES